MPLPPTQPGSLLCDEIEEGSLDGILLTQHCTGGEIPQQGRAKHTRHTSDCHNMPQDNHELWTLLDCFFLHHLVHILLLRPHPFCILGCSSTLPFLGPTLFLAGRLRLLLLQLLLNLDQNAGDQL